MCAEIIIAAIINASVAGATAYASVNEKCEYCGTIHQSYANCINCGAPSRKRANQFQARPERPMAGGDKPGASGTGERERNLAGDNDSIHRWTDYMEARPRDDGYPRDEGVPPTAVPSGGSDSGAQAIVNDILNYSALTSEA